ncbi:MAG TPA: DegT/DnrJ/EryC1/StrS family aminotransferase [Gemmatimonadaceae bacterium]|nr:DegT/DnrJ/EryC1/StrS family aminotransferase [Gemmatimonadaceae bacterium]
MSEHVESHPLRGVRVVPPVYSTVEPGAVARALWQSLADGTRAADDLRAVLARDFAADHVDLTDSGTSALVLALRAATAGGVHGTVAMPAYACIDIIAAARHAGVRVRLYDLDPLTLAPDRDSLKRVLHRGVDAVVVVHLFGYPVDVPAVVALCAEFGASVIEDAAQGAAGRFLQTPLGGFGPMSVLSFGRGKGITGGGGGAFLRRAPARAPAQRTLPVRPSVGVRALAAVGAQWLLARPAVYGLPARIPSLHLGEMVYHEAHEPRPISTAVAMLARNALARAAADAAARRALAERLLAAVASADTVEPIRPITGAEPGYLRLPVLLRQPRAAASWLGILRPYPIGLWEHPEARNCLHREQGELRGATELRDRLVTLPVHERVAERDVQQIEAWLRDR